MKYLFGITFAIIFTAIFIFFSWLLKFLAKGDISRIYRWNKYLYLILMPISCFMYIFEAVKLKAWLTEKNLYAFILIMNIIYIIILLLVWFANHKFQSRKQTTTLKYGIEYHEEKIEFTNDNRQFRTLMLFVISLIVNPILNIICIVLFIKDYLILLY